MYRLKNIQVELDILIQVFKSSHDVDIKYSNRIRELISKYWPKVSTQLAKTSSYLVINFVDIDYVLNFIVFSSKCFIVMQSSNAFKLFDAYVINSLQLL